MNAPLTHPPSPPTATPRCSRSARTHALPQAHLRPACASRRCSAASAGRRARGDAGAGGGGVHRHQPLCCGPGTWRSSQSILGDPEASDNDRFVAYDFLKNANIAAGGVLPMCQDTGTAIIMGKKGRLVFTDGDDEAALAEGARDAYLKRNLRYSQLAPLSMFEENNTKSNMPAQVEIYAEGAGARRGRLQVPVHRQGRRLGQQVVPVPGDAVDPHPRPHAGVPEGEDFDARHRGLPALSPRHRHRRHLGRDDDEDGEARLCALLRRPADAGLGGRPRLPRPRDGARGAQADAVARRRRAVRRQIFLPRRARDPAAAPRRFAADRARRVVLGRPPGARQDHAGTACSWRSSSTIRRNICRRWMRRRSAATWSRSICASR